MQQLTEQLTSLQQEIGSIATQFQSIDLAFPMPSFSFPTDLLDIKFDALTGVVDRFGNLVKTLPTNPEDLLADLLDQFKGLTSGSLQVGDLLNGLTSPFSQAGSVFDKAESIFNVLTIDLFPALLRLKDQPMDATTLSGLLPLSALVTPLTTTIPTLLSPQLNGLTSIRSRLTPLIEPSKISLLLDYQAMLEATVNLQLDPSLTVDQLPKLDAKQLTQLQTQIDRLQQNTETITTDLQNFQNGLDTVPIALNDGLDQVLQLLSPQQLVQTSHPLQNTLASLEKLADVDLSAIVNSVQDVIQPLQQLIDRGVETATQGIHQVVETVKRSIDTVDQAIVKVSALITNAIEQLIGFIQQMDLTSLINQAKDLFQGLMLKLNAVLNQVGGVIEQVYTFVRGMIDKVKALGEKLPPLAEKFRQAIAQLTAFLENPQVKDAVQQAKLGIDTVLAKLDEVSLEPVFDQVLTQVDTVKAALQAIDLSQLNQILKTALSAALGIVKEAIEPPSKVTDVVKEQYNTLIADPFINTLIKPVKLTIDEFVNLIHQLEPGSLVGALLTPLYEAAIAGVKKFVSPDEIAKALKPLTDFQADLLQQIDRVINPQNLLQPLVDIYGQVMTFVRSLDATAILTPLNELLHQATQPLENLGLENLVATVTASVRRVTDWIRNLKIDDRVLDQDIEALLESWVNQLKNVVNKLDLSSLTTLFQPLRTAVATLVDQTQWEGTPLELLKQIQSMATQVKQYATQYGKQMAALTQTWQQQCDRLSGFQPDSTFQLEYDAFKIQYQSLSPISRLATLTQILDRLADITHAILTTLQKTWQSGHDRLKQSQKFLDGILNDTADGWKGYLNEAIDALMAGPLKVVIRTLKPPLIQLKSVIKSIFKLQDSLQAFDVIPQSIQEIGDAIVGVKNRICNFKFDFLTAPLERVLDEIQKPLEALDPEPLLIVPFTQIYQKVLKMVKNLNPVHLFATARGAITLTSTVPMTLPMGSSLAAKTPQDEEIWFETGLEVTLAANSSTAVPIGAIVSGRFGDIVGLEGVTWRVADQRDLTASHDRPILSLITIVQEEMLGILKVFDPVKLIAEPLNEQYQKILKLFDDLGIVKLFDTLFKKIDSIDQEIEAGLDRLGGAFGGLVAAIPL